MMSFSSLVARCLAITALFVLGCKSCGTRSCDDRHPCRAVALSVRATNVGVAPIHLRLRQEYHGGALLPSSLAACVRAAGSLKHASCDTAYLVERAPLRSRSESPVMELTLAPAQTTTFDIRLDWAGTGSIIGEPLVDPAHGARYDVAVGLVFRAGNIGRVAYSDVASIVVT